MQNKNRHFERLEVGKILYFSMGYLFLCFFELSFLLLDSLNKHLPHFFFLLLQLAHELVPLSFICLLKAGRKKEEKDKNLKRRNITLDNALYNTPDANWCNVANKLKVAVTNGSRKMLTVSKI